MDGIRFRFDTGTADSNPAAGYLKLNNADESAATFAYVSKTDRFGNDVEALLLTLDDSDSDLRAVLWVCDRDDPSKSLVLHVTGAVVGAVGYVKVPIVVAGELGGADPLDLDAELSLAWAFTGDVGSAEGPQGDPGSQWLTGAGTPLDANGADGDLYLRTSTGDVYQKAAGTWGSPIANLTGPQGDDGLQGDDGDAGDEGPQGETGPASAALVYVFSSTTTLADPGAGVIRLSNADQEAADVLVIDDLDAAGSDVQKFLRTWNELDGDTLRGVVWLQRRAAPTAGHVMRVLNVVEQAGYFEVSVESLVETGPEDPLEDGDEVLVSYYYGGVPGESSVESVNGDAGPAVLLDAADIPFDPGSPPILSATDVQEAIEEIVADAAAVPRREVLTANRTYYVRSDGSDSNTGLANTAGGAFLTLSKAAAIVGGLDLSIYTVTIKFGLAGTYAGATFSGPHVGGFGSAVQVEGDTAAPGSYVISSALGANFGARIFVKGVDFTSSGLGIQCTNGSYVQQNGAVIFGACTSEHINADRLSIVHLNANYTIDGNAPRHFVATNGSVIRASGLTVTLTGTPAFSLRFAYCERASVMQLNANTYSGAATGSRYSVVSNGVIDTAGGGATYLPGNAADATPTATGGQYI